MPTLASIVVGLEVVVDVAEAAPSSASAAAVEHVVVVKACSSYLYQI